MARRTRGTAWARSAPYPSLLVLRERRYASIQLSDRLADLLPPRLVRRRPKLLTELRAGQAERFELPRELRIHRRPWLATLLPGVFPFLQALLNPLVRVDQSFSSVTHSYLVGRR